MRFKTKIVGELGGVIKKSHIEKENRLNTRANTSEM